ncbi:MAG: type II secretion system F family protein, partial [Burkholderiales bacterium]
MPAYKFEAINTEGKSSSGLLEADNIKAARAQLRAQALVPMNVTLVSSTRGLGAAATFKRRVFSATGLAVWTRQIAGLVSSGLPLERALTALSEESASDSERELLAHLRAEVNSGAPFAQALSSAPQEFDEVYCGVVAAGEQSGALGLVLERLADALEERQTLRSKLVAATLYPAIVSVIAILIVIFLMTYVVPQVASVFTSSKRTLPMLTVVMLQVSSFLKNHGWLLLLGIVSTAAGLTLMRRHSSFRTSFDAAWLRLPLVGRLSRGYNA